MKWQYVQSTAIRGYRYDPAAKALDVEYIDGDIYRYFEVTERERSELEEAPSKGTYVNQRIKQHDFQIIRKRSA
jgi:lysyl-tRNA synthetase class 2